MTSVELLEDAFGRIGALVDRVVHGLDPEELGYRVDGETNSIAWLVWHLTRIQDDHIADAAGVEQVWTAQDWLGRFGLPFGPKATGYGHSSADVAALGGVASELLAGYHHAVAEQTAQFVRGLDEADFARVVDEGWDPPVTLAVRLVSVISDDLQHVGQAALVRGIAERARRGR
jgi:hypothetical protein